MRAALEQQLLQWWAGRGLASTLLLPWSWVYGALVRLRHLAYRLGILRTASVPIPVVVVGNVMAGGVGKTPVVMALVAHLQASGIQVGVISRGYGRQTDDCREVQTQSRAQDSGDEALLLRRRCGVPVFVARDRAEAAKALLAAYPHTQVLISDDGLQHLALGRDIEIGVFDERGVGNGRLLPAGPLREPWPRQLDLVLHTGPSAAFAGFGAQRALAAYAVRHDGQQLPLAQLLGQPIVAAAGIAKPERFFAMLRERGLSLQNAIALPDHFDYETWQVELPSAAVLLCTEKDAVKLWSRYPQALAVPLQLTLAPAFLRQFDQLLRAAQRAKLSSATVPDAELD